MTKLASILSTSCNIQHLAHQQSQHKLQWSMLQKNFSPVPAAKYSNSTKLSTQPRHQANKGKRRLEAEIFWALGELCSLCSKKKLAAEKWQDTYFLSNEDTEKWCEDYVGRETAGVWKRVEDTEAAIGPEQEDTWTANDAGLTTRASEKTFSEIIFAITDTLSDLPSSNDGEDGQDEDDEETEQGKLSEDDECGWVIGKISKTVHHRMEMFWQNQIKLHEVTKPELEDAADYFHPRHEQYGTSELRVSAVVNLHMADDAAVPAPTTFGELMECLDIVPGISRMPQGTSRPGSSAMRLDCGKPQLATWIAGLAPATELHLSPMWKAKPVELLSCDHVRGPPQLITVWKSDSDGDMLTAPASSEEQLGILIFVTSHLGEK